MATDSEKSISRNSESENPKKTLNPPNLTGESKEPKLEKPQFQTQLDDVTPDEGTDKEEANDSTVKGTNSSVVSPTGADGGGAANDIQKKLRRAERFGVPVQLSEEEKRNSRAERFGTVSGSEVVSEEQKRKARAERFGLSVASDNEAKKKARLARFGSEAKINTQEEEKRKARAIRFSQAGTYNVPHINHEGDVGPKTAIAGDANGGA